VMTLMGVAVALVSLTRPKRTVGAR
jgi:hypothetical protein